MGHARRLLAALAVTFVAAPAHAATKRPTCPAKTGTLHKTKSDRVWHEGPSLYACTNATSDRRLRTRRVGPWTRTSKIVVKGGYAVWTTANGPDDRLWAGWLWGRRYLSGSPAVPKSSAGPWREGTVERLLVTDMGGAWITTEGDVVLTAYSLVEEVDVSGTLPFRPRQSGNTVLIGSWPDADATELAATVRLTGENGEVDDCGGSRLYTVALVPQTGGERVSVQWRGDSPPDPDAC